MGVKVGVAVDVAVALAVGVVVGVGVDVAVAVTVGVSVGLKAAHTARGALGRSTTVRTQESAMTSRASPAKNTFRR